MATGGGVERRSGKRSGVGRAAIVLIGLVAVVATGIAIRRGTTLRGLPDIGDPFDVAAYAVEIPDDENAFTFYRKASELYRDQTQPGTMKGSYLDWSEVSPAEIHHLDANRGALLAWLEGTTRDRAMQVQPGLVNADTPLTPTQNLRNLSRIANLAGLVREHEGDFAGAWRYYLGNLRASRHSGTNGLPIERLVGIAIFAATVPQAIRWADNPKVDAPMLRRALADVLAMDGLTPSDRDFLRVEYDSTMNTLADPSMSDRGLAELIIAGEPIALKHRVKIRVLSVGAALILREPERSRRVIRLVTANWLAVADLPAAEKAKRAVTLGNVVLFWPAPGEVSPIPIEEIAAWYKSTWYASHFYIQLGQIVRSLQRDESERSKLIVHVAEQLYLREKGKPPSSPTDLVGPYLAALPVGYVPPEAKP